MATAASRVSAAVLCNRWRLCGRADDEDDDDAEAEAEAGALLSSGQVLPVLRTAMPASVMR